MKAIAAMDLNRVIGYQDKIPWRLGEDFKWFKQQTMGGKLIMGRITYENVGTLPGRFTYVLTNNLEKLKSPKILPSIWSSSLSTAQYVNYSEIIRLNQSLELWVCGGAKTYELLLPHCCLLLLTIVLDEYEGDTYMPEFESIFPYSEIIKETKKYWIVKFWK
jgi:dihydrofolate reductase